MELLNLKLSKAELLAIPQEERIFFVQLTNFADEINILQKVIYYSSKQTDNEVIRRAQICQSLFFIRILAGKLFEGWEFLGSHFFGAKLSKEYEKALTGIGRNCLKKLKQYFDKNNVINLIRNEFAFHYSSVSSKKINQVILDADDSENFEIFLSESHGNCLYYLSHVLVNSAILRHTGSPTLEEAADKLLKEITKVASCFSEFIGDCLTIVIKKYFGRKHGQIQIPASYVNEVSLPYFVMKIRGT